MSGAEVGQYVFAAASASADFICAREAGEPSWRGGQPVGSGGGGGGGACVSCAGFAAAGDDVVAVGFDAGRTLGEALGELLGAALWLGASPNSVRASGVAVVAVGNTSVVLVSPVGPVASGTPPPAHPTVSSTTASAPTPIRSILMSPPPTDAR
ncbi:hypothetical protein [Salinispora cortesiana]|uniref:hypothetical protein n=1 Tax=Salinispora cortesiana TaxID=1305843 RepID=UPI0004A4EE4F